MDKMQKDHEYMLLNIIKENGERKLRIIGIGYVTEPGAIGHLAALAAGASDTVGFDKILKVINHLSTDGENKNVGQHRGLWKFIDDERELTGVTFQLLKSVCAVHSTANAYKDLIKSVPEIDHLVTTMAGIAAFFHSSAKHTTDLEKIGKREGLTVRRIPKYFEIRWSEFTAALLDAILCSSQALIKFSTEQRDTEGRMFLKLLTNKHNILMMCFVADLLFVFKMFQKKLQLSTLNKKHKHFKKRINRLNGSSLLGGWEEAFKQKFDK